MRRKIIIAAFVAAFVLAAATPARGVVPLSPTDPTTALGDFTALTTAAKKQAVLLTADNFTLICETSQMTMNYIVLGAAKVTSFSMGTCRTVFGLSCTVTVDGTTLGDYTTAGAVFVEVGGTGGGTVTLGTDATITANVTCFGITCNYNFDTSNSASFESGDPAKLIFSTALTTTSGGACTGGVFKAAFTITTVDAGTGTPTPDDTRLTLSS